MAQILGAIILGIGAGFLLIILGTFFGGVAGWTVGLLFDAPGQVAALIGLPDLSNFGVGALLGFVGSFLKTSVSSSS